MKSSSGWEHLLESFAAKENGLVMCVPNDFLKYSFQQFTPPLVHCTFKPPMREGSVEPIKHESGKKWGVGAGSSLLFTAIVLVCVNTFQKRA